MPDIIDIHAHIFPQNVFEKIWRYFDQHHWPVIYRTGEAERTAFLEARVSAYTTLCYAHKPGMAAWLNDYVLAYCQDHPKAIPTGTFHPDDPDVLAYVESGIRRGLRGFKLHLEVQRFDPADPRLFPVYGLLTEAGCVAQVHSAGMPLAGPWTGPEHFARMLALAPRLTVILAHLGGEEFGDYLRLADRHPLYFDTAMVGVDHPPFAPIPASFYGLLRDHAERIVFGSDFPNLPYPWERQIEALRSWGLSASAEALVLSGNARRLYKLEPQQS